MMIVTAKHMCALHAPTSPPDLSTGVASLLSAKMRQGLVSRQGVSRSSTHFVVTLQELTVVVLSATGLVSPTVCVQCVSVAVVTISTRLPHIMGLPWVFYILRAHLFR
jgi:hypothetical protein